MIPSPKRIAKKGIDISDSIKRIRNEICDIIASSDSQEEYVKVESLLKSIFNNINWIDNSLPYHHNSHEQHRDEHVSPGRLSTIHENFPEGSNRDQHVTPLMLACDKLKFHAIRAMNNQYVRIFTAVSQEEGKSKERKHNEIDLVGRLIGHPFDTCHDGGNMAAHYAAFSASSNTSNHTKNTFDALLETLIIRQRLGHQLHVSDTNFKADERNTVNNDFKSLIALLGKGNENGDTPVMIISAKGCHNLLDHLINNLEVTSTGSNHIHNSSISNNYDNYMTQEYFPSKPSIGLPWKKALAQIRDLFSRVNHVGETALSLSVRHGHLDVVFSLTKDRTPPQNKISEDHQCDSNGRSTEDDERITKNALVQVTYKDIEQNQKYLQRMDAFLAVNTDATLEEVLAEGIQEFRERRDYIHRCIDELHASFAKISERATEVLLSEEKTSANKDSSSYNKMEYSTMPMQKVKKKKKKKRKQSAKNQNLNCSDATKMEHPLEISCCTNSSLPSTRNTNSDKNEMNTSTQFKRTVQISSSDEMSIQKKEASSSPQNTEVGLHSGQYIQAKISAPPHNKSNSAEIESNGAKTPQTIISPLVSSQLDFDDGDYPKLQQEKKNQEIDAHAVIESLSLDSSMLLLSVTDMINLSACQLDAVENVLKDQLKIVQKAKDIHKQRLTTSIDES